MRSPSTEERIKRLARPVRRRRQLHERAVRTGVSQSTTCRSYGLPPTFHEIKPVLVDVMGTEWTASLRHVQHVRRLPTGWRAAPANANRSDRSLGKPLMIAMAANSSECIVGSILFDNFLN